MFRIVHAICLVISLLACPSLCAGGTNSEAAIAMTAETCGCCEVPGQPSGKVPERQDECYCSCLCKGAVLSQDDFDLSCHCSVFIPVACHDRLEAALGNSRGHAREIASANRPRGPASGWAVRIILASIVI